MVVSAVTSIWSFLLNHPWATRGLLMEGEPVESSSPSRFTSYAAPCFKKLLAALAAVAVRE